MPYIDSKSQPAINAATQVLTGAGRLRRVIVQATGAGIATVYDNTSATGTPIFSVPASAAVGTVYDLDIPITTGIHVVVAATGPQLTVLFQGA